MIELTVLLRRLGLVSFTAMLCILGACSDDTNEQTSIESAARAGVDFTQFHTFRVLDTATRAADAGVEPPAIPANVKVNLDAANDQTAIELKAIGLTEASAGQQPDLVVFSMGATEEELAAYWSCVPGYWWGYWGWSWDPCAWLEPLYDVYEEGTVVTGLVDPKTQSVVFGGVIRGVIDDDDADDIDQRIRKGVEKIYDDYPSKPAP